MKSKKKRIEGRSSTIYTKKLCFWNKNKRYLKRMNWFVVDIGMDLITPEKQLTDELRELAAFDHRYLHSTESYCGVKEEETTLTPVFSFHKKKHTPIIPLVSNTFATLGTFVYSLGGTFEEGKQWDKDSKISGSNLVFCFDTNKNKHDDICSWNQAPSMITHRQSAQAVTLDNKLYVFGCFGKKRCPHMPRCPVWAEVFDPSIGEWSSLSVPQFDETLGIGFPNHTDLNQTSKEISALADYKLFYELNVETKGWTLVTKLPSRISQFVEDIKQTLLLKNTIFWFDNYAFAYDTLKEKLYEGPVQDLSFERAMNMPDKEYPPELADVKPVVVHLGGRYFCVLSYLSGLGEAKPRRIHCLIVKLSKTKQPYKDTINGIITSEFFLRARVISCQSFPIDRKLDFLDARVLTI